MKRTGIDEIMKPEQLRPWLAEFTSGEVPTRELEPLWAILRQTGDKTTSQEAFARYEGVIRRAIPTIASIEVAPERTQFERYWMRFERLLLWRLRDREFFLGVESTDYDICIRAGVRPL
jgi:hypothetical protein